MGYTPLFDTLTKGTLCGRWPDIGLWPIVLSLTDRNGHVDATPAFLASVTGLPLEEVVACMARFCEPDALSRSQEHGGARLKLLDPSRPWGWLVVNHTKYREKARKHAYDTSRTENGEDAARKRASRDVPTHPAPSRSPNTNTNTNTNKAQEGAQGAHVVGLDLKAWERWEAYRREIRKPIKPGSVQAAQLKLAGFGADQAAVVEESIAQGWTGLFPLKRAGDAKQKLTWRPPPDEPEAASA